MMYSFHNISGVIRNTVQAILAAPAHHTDSVRLRAARGVSWSVVGSVISQAIGFAAAVACARILGAKAYGQLGIVLSTSNLFASFASLGLGVTAAKMVAQHFRTTPGAAGRTIAMSTLTSSAAGLIAASMMFFGSGYLSRTALAAPGLEGDIRAGALIMFFNAVNGGQIGSLAGFEAFRSLAAVNCLRSVLSVAILVPATLLGGVRGAVWANVILAAVNCLLHQAALRRECARHTVPVSYRLNRRDLSALFSLGIPVMFASLALTPAAWFANTLLIRNAGYEAMGVFQVAMQWQTAALFFATAASRVGLPLLSSTAAEKNAGKYRRCVGLNYAITAGTTLAVAVPLFFAAPLLSRLYGHGYVGLVPVIRLILLWSVLTAVNMPPGHIIWSFERAGAGLGFALLSAATLVVMAVFLTPFGAPGLAWAYVAQTTFLALCQTPYIRHIVMSETVRWQIDTKREACTVA